MAASGSTESRLQSFIHALEQGNLVSLIRAIVAMTIILAVALVFLGWKFRGFAAPEAMDQAQVASEIASGNGWCTRFVRPLAIWQFEQNRGASPKGIFPDTYNAPLPPFLNSFAVRLAGNEMEFKHNEYIAPAERFIVALSMLCFVASVVVEYFLLQRVFDQRLAFWAAVLTLVCNLCWQFTLSGLPQMLMLLLFNLMLYALARAIEAQRELELSGQIINAETGEIAPPGRPMAVIIWLAAAGLMCALLTLSHAVAIWIFFGLLAFTAFHFQRRVVCLLVLLASFGVLYAPWLARNYGVCGNPFGLAGYALYDNVSGTTSMRMRSPSGPMTDGIQLYYFRTKIEDGIVSQMSHLTENLGDNLLAVAFFVSLLHSFRRREVNRLRWAVLVMWGAAVLGMSLLGTTGAAVEANQIGVLFLPVMLGFGLAFILVLFGRREGGVGSAARLVLFSVLFVISSVPLIFSLLPRNSLPYQYPPYLEPGINKLKDWTKPEEVIGSDMPWAVAWYAERQSLWIPNHYADFMGMSDYSRLPGPLAGLFLTTLSRNEPFYSSIYRGDYQEWQQLIFGRTDLPTFPFKESKFVLGDLSYTFYSDTKRWDHPNKSDTP